MSSGDDKKSAEEGAWGWGALGAIGAFCREHFVELVLGWAVVPGDEPRRVNARETVGGADCCLLLLAFSFSRTSANGGERRLSRCCFPEHLAVVMGVRVPLRALWVRVGIITVPHEDVVSLPFPLGGSLWVWHQRDCSFVSPSCAASDVIGAKHPLRVFFFPLRRPALPCSKHLLRETTCSKREQLRTCFPYV